MAILMFLKLNILDTVKHDQMNIPSFQSKDTFA